jgi:flagellar motor switch/type III secretory pathway protein FliN
VANLRVTRLGAPTVQAVELEILGGVVGLRGKPGAVVAEVATGYVPRAMSLPDDAHVELTVGLGTTRMSLRQVFELAVGQVVPLGRPLAGPFDVRAAGKFVGKGELVDVDGELAVRIVSLGDQE